MATLFSLLANTVGIACKCIIPEESTGIGNTSPVTDKDKIETVTSSSLLALKYSKKYIVIVTYSPKNAKVASFS
jgi:hypothetical protein